MDPDSITSVDRYGIWIWIQEGKKLINFIFCSAGCSLFRAEDFSCILDGLYGGQGISKQQFFYQKKYPFLLSAVHFSKFWSSEPWIGIGIQTKMLDPDPELINPNPKHCLELLPAVVERVPGKVHGCAGVDDGGQNAVCDAPSLRGLQYSQLTACSYQETLINLDPVTQCFGSGSGLDPDSIRSVDPYQDPESGSRMAKMTHKYREKKNKVSCF